MIRLIDIDKVYSLKKTNEVKALNNISLDLPSSGLVFLIGKSGSGKSTLLNILGGLDKQTNGKIFIENNELDIKSNDIDYYRACYTSFVFQEYNLIDDYTIEKNISLALEIQGKTVTKELIDETLKKVDLLGYEKRYVYELSGGQKQRMAIARALIRDSKIILADEPTANIDEDTSEEIFELLKKISRDRLVIVATHDIDIANRYHDRTIEIKDGFIISDTGEYHINNENTNKYQVIKTGFKWLNVLFLSIKSILLKKTRLLISTLLAVTSLTFLGLAWSLFSMDISNQYAKELADRNITQFQLSKENNTSMEQDIYFSDTEIDSIRSQFPECSVIPILNNIRSGGFYNLKADRDIVNYERLIGKDGKNILLIEQEDLKKNNFELVAGRLPDSSKSEFLITKFQLDIYKTLGMYHLFYDISNQTIIYDIKPEEFSNDDDYNLSLIAPKINLPFEDSSICGVIDTKFEYHFTKEYFENLYVDEFTMTEEAEKFLDYINKNKFHNSFFTGNRDIKYENMVGNFKISNSIINFKETNVDDLKTIIKYGLNNEYIINTELFNYYYNTNNTAKEIRPYVFYIGIGFLVISSLLIYNFVSTNIEMKKHEIGIFRALGAKKKDVLKIYICEGLILSIISTVIAFIITAVITITELNRIVDGMHSKYLLLEINITHFLVLFGVSLLAYTIASIVPVYKIIRKTPIEAINS